MRILLVKPHPELLIARCLQEGFLHLEPLELEIVAAGVPKEDEVVILDLSLEKKDPIAAFQKQLHQQSPHIVGFTGYSSNAPVVKKLAELAKAHNPSVVTVAGGIHATIVPADYAGSSIDLIVRGEGGTAFAELLSRFKKGEPLFFDTRCLSSEDPEFLQKAALPPPEFPKVEDIPSPRRELVERNRYFCIWTSSESRRLDRLFPPVASLRTSLGCVFSCSFCVVHHVMHGKYLQRRPQDVADEIESLAEDYIYFVDDETFLNAKRMERLGEILLARGIRKHYISWARSDTIVKHPELFRLWKEAGLSTVYVGLESLDNARLHEYGKRTSLEINRKAIAILRELGITLHASFIVHPDFTQKDFLRLEKEVADICPAEVTFTVLSPSPGTPFWHENKHRFICDPYRFYDCMHTILPTRLPLKLFYQHFARLTAVALRSNPLRAHRIRVPVRDFIRAIVMGTKYIFSLRKIYTDYPH